MFFALTARAARPPGRVARAAFRSDARDVRARARWIEPAGDDPELWPRAARCWRRTAITVHTAVVMEVLGEALYIGPYLSSVVLGGALLG